MHHCVLFIKATLISQVIFLLKNDYLFTNFLLPAAAKRKLNPFDPTNFLSYVTWKVCFINNIINSFRVQIISSTTQMVNILVATCRMYY